MYIESVAHYLPTDRIPNSYFLNVNGLSDEWIVTRTGINSRSRASEGENTNTMALEASKVVLANSKQNISDIDLIIGASYTPFDTVATIAHYVQQKLKISGARALYISSACSSLINAIEIVEGYFATGKANTALVITSEHNWHYSHPHDEKSGHLWGDGAAAMIITKEPGAQVIAKIEDSYTMGLGDVGLGPDAVYLQPRNEGLIMPNGKDVFVNACTYMVSALNLILDRNQISMDQLSYIIPHQANMRIISNIANQLSFDESKIIRNIDRLGNTGSASTLIALSENLEMLMRSGYSAITVFGGGYSTGSMLLNFN